MTKCKWPKCIEEGCTPLARQFKSCYDSDTRPCSAADRDNIRAAALERSAGLVALADELEYKGDRNIGRYARDVMADAAAQLRQLAEGV